MRKVRAFLIKNFEIVRMMFAIALALIIIFAAVFFISDQPGDVLYWFVVGPLTSIRRLGTVIELFIPLSFCGLGMCMMLQVNRFNLSGDGAFFIAGSVTAILALKLDLPPVIFPIVIILVSGCVGGLVGLVPAVINERYKANIVVASIMLNYVMLYAGRFVLIEWLKDPTASYNGTEFFPEKALLPRFIPKTRIHVGIFILIFVIVVVCILVFRTKSGFAMRLSGQNAEFARYVGIDTKKTILLAQFLGGGLAGIGGSIECLGIYQQLNWEGLLGYGFDGMIIAIIAKNNPVVVPVVALLFSYLRAGGDLVNRMTDVPAELVFVIQSLVIIFIGAKHLLAGTRHRLMLKNAVADEKKGEIA